MRAPVKPKRILTEKQYMTSLKTLEKAKQKRLEANKKKKSEEEFTNQIQVCKK